MVSFVGGDLMLVSDGDLIRRVKSPKRLGDLEGLLTTASLLSDAAAATAPV